MYGLALHSPATTRDFIVPKLISLDHCHYLVHSVQNGGFVFVVDFVLFGLLVVRANSTTEERLVILSMHNK